MHIGPMSFQIKRRHPFSLKLNRLVTHIHNTMSIQAIQYHCNECEHTFPSWECGGWHEDAESRCRRCKSAHEEWDIHTCPLCHGAAYAPELVGSQQDDMIAILETMMKEVEYDTAFLWARFAHELYKTWWFDETKETIQACYLTVLAAPHQDKQMVIGMLENWYLKAE